MSAPKRSKPNDRTQPSIRDMFGNRSNRLQGSSSDVVNDESKQNILIDMVVDQVKSENGTDWTFLFNFDLHFVAPGSQLVDFEDDVEIENASSSRASSAATSRSGTPMEADVGSDGDTSSIGSTG